MNQTAIVVNLVGLNPRDVAYLLFSVIAGIIGLCTARCFLDYLGEAAEGLFKLPPFKGSRTEWWLTHGVMSVAMAFVFATWTLGYVHSMPEGPAFVKYFGFQIIVAICPVVFLKCLLPWILRWKCFRLKEPPQGSPSP